MYYICKSLESVAKSALVAMGSTTEDTFELVGNVLAEFVNCPYPVLLEPEGPFVSVPF